MRVGGSLRPGAAQPEKAGTWHDRPPEELLGPVVVHAYDTAIGVDLSYSGRGDSSALCVVSRECADWTRDRYYVRAMWSGPRELRSLRRTLDSYRNIYPTAHFVSYCSGMERGVLGMLDEESRDEEGRPIAPISILPMVTNDSKASRAAGTIELWNQGRVILPNATWAHNLANRVKGFDGSPGGADDEVDALVSAVEYLRKVGGASTAMLTGRRTSR